MPERLLNSEYPQHPTQAQPPHRRSPPPRPSQLIGDDVFQSSFQIRCMVTSNLAPTFSTRCDKFKSHAMAASPLQVLLPFLVPLYSL